MAPTSTVSFMSLTFRLIVPFVARIPLIPALMVGRIACFLWFVYIALKLMAIMSKAVFTASFRSDFTDLFFCFVHDVYQKSVDKSAYWQAFHPVFAASDLRTWHLGWCSPRSLGLLGMMPRNLGSCSCLASPYTLFLRQSILKKLVDWFCQLLVNRFARLCCRLVAAAEFLVPVLLYFFIWIKKGIVVPICCSSLRPLSFTVLLKSASFSSISQLNCWNSAVLSRFARSECPVSFWLPSFFTFDFFISLRLREVFSPVFH